MDSHLDKIENPLHSEALESKYIFFKHHKIQVRSPFYDKKLIEFCLSLPSRWKLRNGRTRYILRSYLISRDLDMIGNRNKKANLGYGLRHNITQLDLHKIKREINNVHPYLKGFIDTGVLSKYVNSVENTQKIEDFKLTSLLAFFSANTWLHHEMTERLTCKVQT